jgi:hypothetical protein
MIPSMQRGRLLVAAAVFVLLGSACGGGGEPSAGEATTGGETTTATTTESSRCKPVPPGLKKGIEEGLNVTGGGTLANAQAVKSEDFKRVYFISAEINGPGMEKTGEIGTWAKSGTLQVGDGLILSVDGLANEFSDWGDGGKTDAQLSMDDDGAQESHDCVADSQ